MGGQVDGWNNAVFPPVCSGQKDNLPFIVYARSEVLGNTKNTDSVQFYDRLLHKQTSRTSDYGIALITRTYSLLTELLWSAGEQKKVNTFLSCSNNLNYGNCFLAVSRSLSEFFAVVWTLVQNVMAVGHHRVTAASTPLAPWEPVQLWIVF